MGGGGSSSQTMENLQNTLPPRQVIIPDESATGQVVLNEAAARQAYHDIILPHFEGVGTAAPTWEQFVYCHCDG